MSCLARTSHQGGCPCIGPVPRTLLAAALTLLLVGACGGGGKGKGEGDLLREGRAALARGDSARAVALLKKAVAKSPRNAGTRLTLALALEQTKALREAERVLRDGLAQQPGQASLWNGLGRILRLRGKYDQAVKALARARRLDPRDPEPALQLGEIYERYRKWEIARSHYRAVLAASERPSHRVMAHRRLARLDRRENKLAGAIAELRQALRLAPRRPALLGELGEALRLAGRPAEALVPLRRRVKLEPDSGAAQLGLGLALRELGNHEKAVRALRLAAQLSPRKAAPLLPLARSLLALDRAGEAYTVGVKALALAPTDPAVMWLMAPLYQSRKLYGPAAELIAKLQPTRSHDARYWQLAGAVHSGLGKHADARQDYARALTLRPRDPKLVRLLAIAARRSGDYKSARRHLLAVLKLEPEDYDIGVHLAITEEHLKQRLAARRRLLGLARLRPRRPEAHVYLGWLALRSGALARAVKLAELADGLAGGKSAHALDVLAQAHLRRRDLAAARKVVARALALPLSAGDRAYFRKLVAPEKKTPGPPTPKKQSKKQPGPGMGPKPPG